MFTEKVTEEKANDFSRLIGTPLLSTEVLRPNTNRAEYFSCCRGVGNLFLDPDTGVCLNERRGRKSENCVFANELVELSASRPQALTLVFDQSYSRGIPKKTLINEKMGWFRERSVYGFIYDSHSTLLLLGSNAALVKRAQRRLPEISGLPDWRLIGLTRIVT